VYGHTAGWEKNPSTPAAAAAAVLQLHKPTLRTRWCLRSQSGSKCKSAGPFAAWQQHASQNIHISRVRLNPFFDMNMLSSLLLLLLLYFAAAQANFEKALVLAQSLGSECRSPGPFVAWQQHASCRA
jgi:hypothetical protein